MMRRGVLAASRRRVAPTLLASETWTGSNGAAWPAGWTTSGTGTATIQTNRGRLATTAAAWDALRAYRSTMAAVADSDTVILFTPPASGTWWVTLGARTDGATQLTGNGGLGRNGIYAQFGSNGGLGMFRNVADVSTTVAQATPGIVATTYRLRLRLVGGGYQARLSDAASAEPAAWTIDHTDTAPYTTAGRVFLSVAAGGEGVARSVDFDDLTVLTA